jgi:hypothetical protein
MNKLKYYITSEWGLSNLIDDTLLIAKQFGYKLWFNDAKKPTQCWMYDEPSDEFINSEYAIKIVNIEEIEVEQKKTVLERDTRYENGYNWKNTQVIGANAKLRKKGTSTDYDPTWIKEFHNPSKLPINPKTGLRDGKN